MNKKLIYILPEASKVTHMKYNLEFIESLAKNKNVDIYLILERGDNNLELIKNTTGVKFIAYTGTNFYTRIPRFVYFLIDARLRSYKIVYVHYSFVAAICASLFPFLKVYYWNCGIPMKYKRPFLQEFYESMTYKSIDYFVTGADILISKYTKYYNFDKSKAVVIPNWIDVKYVKEILVKTDKNNLRQELNLKENQKVLFFNQRLSERKGAHYIIPILENTFDDVVMIITNDGPYKQNLLDNLNLKNLNSRVRILGRVENKRVIELLSITDVYVLPSEEEGMSHSLMEAMSSGVATVSFDVGATIDMYPEEYKDYVVEVTDIVKFNQKVNFLLDNNGEKNNLGLALQEKAREYDKPIILDKFVDIIYKK